MASLSYESSPFGTETLSGENKFYLLNVYVPSNEILQTTWKCRNKILRNNNSMTSWHNRLGIEWNMTNVQIDQLVWNGILNFFGDEEYDTCVTCFKEKYAKSNGKRPIRLQKFCS